MQATGHILCSEALEAAQGMKPGGFRLVYIDPPFGTDQDFAGRKGAGGFSDRWKGGMEEYLAFLGPRLEALWRLLGPDGNLLVHGDWRSIHHVRVLADRILGAEAFQNELIWSYNSGGGSRRRYGRKHDTILWYGQGKAPYFDAEAARVPYSAVIARKRESLFHPAGKVSGDVLAIPRPPNHSEEWTGWPTQKPLALLRFLVRVHSAPGDLVGDFFAGSGTTAVAAAMEGRRFFASDVSPDAVRIMKERLGKIPGGPKLFDGLDEGPRTTHA